MKHISTYLNSVLERMRVVYPDTLFPLEWSNLLEDRCPICSCRIYQMKNGRWHCRSNKHKKFVINNTVRNQLCKELKEKYN